MRERELRVLLLGALRPVPDFSGLSTLHESSSSQLRNLLRWLDQSGLALYLLTQLQDHGVLEAVPDEFRVALQHRLKANRERTRAMNGEFERLVQSFRQNGVQFCALKGLTLTPEFCPSAELRHQTDFDFLVAPGWLENAKQAVRSCGYEQQATEAHEVTFATPLLHVPSPHDDIYAIARHREVDLITTLHQTTHGVSIDAPTGVFDRVENKTLQGLSFPALRAEDMFCLQVMHAFRHLLGSWIRVSWLFEIGYFMDRHYGDANLWRTVSERMGLHAKARNAFGLVVSLTKTLFPRRIPQALDNWCLRSLPARIEAWVAQFGLKTAISDLNGAKWTLFVHREFVDDPDSWNSYVRQRIFPVGRGSSIGTVQTTDVGTRMRARLSQLRHTMHRSIFHAGTLFSLPLEAIRWKYAQRSLERQRVLASPSPIR
jgi:Uncharacterised nucleotidyltransferase